MKKYLLFILSGLALQPAYAKSKKNQNHLHGNNLTQHILSKQTARKSAQKTTATNLRLIAYSYIADGAIIDTAHYYYSNGRGSDLTNPDTYADLYVAGMYDEKQTIKSDSSKVWNDWSGQENLLLVNFKSYEYDASNRPIKARQSYLNSSYTSDVTHDITYDAHGRRISDVQSDTFAGTPFEPKLKHHFTYDAQGKLLLDSIAIITPGMEGGRVEYVHDANGNLVSFTNYQFMVTSLIKSYSREYTYDANNRLIKDFYTSYDWSTGAPQYSFYDTLEYVGNNPLYSVKMGFYSTGSFAWTPSYREEYQFNTAGAIDTYYVQAFDPANSKWDTTERDVYYYHPNGLIDYHQGFQHVGNGIFDPTPYDKQTYYYEEYFPTSVSNLVKAANSDIVVYPNPVQDRLHINTQQKGAGTLSIYNMQGQEVMQQSFEQLNGLDIHISALPAANYIINVKDAAGKVNHLQQITKQ